MTKRLKWLKATILIIISFDIAYVLSESPLLLSFVTIRFIVFDTYPYLKSIAIVLLFLMLMNYRLWLWSLLDRLFVHVTKNNNSTVLPAGLIGHRFAEVKLLTRRLLFASSIFNVTGRLMIRRRTTMVLLYFLRGSRRRSWISQIV